MQYYHVSMLNLKPDSILQKGEYYGKGVKERLKTINDNNKFDWLKCKEKTCSDDFCEYIFEKVRNEKFSNDVSRLNCIYACKDIASAKQFRDNHRKGGYIYEIEPVNENPKTFEGNFDTIDSKYPKTTEYIKKMKKELCQEVNALQNEFIPKIPFRVIEIINRTAAEEYWSSIKIENAMIEVLIEDNVKIIKKIE